MTKNQATSNLYMGTSGLLLPVPNKSYYPEAYRQSSRLCYYASLVNSIEINSSFYKIPMASTVAKWAAEVPDDFNFTFKLFKEITHTKASVFDLQWIAPFFTAIDQVGEKKGCVLVQFPPSIGIAKFNQISILFSALYEANKNSHWPIAVEFRNRSLYDGLVYELLASLKFALVHHDKPPAITPFGEVDANFAYFRFHGPDGDYRGSYSEMILSEYAGYIKEWLEEKKQVFVYFNNTMGNAHGNLASLHEMIEL